MRRVRYALILIVIILLAFVGGFPAYLAMGQMGSDTVTIIVSAQPVWASTEGGVAGLDGEDECPTGSMSTAGMLTAGGLVIRPITIVSFDERLCLTIDVGTTILTPDGECPRCIGININGMGIIASPPEEACIIGCMYDAFPDGAIFTPPATLTYSYDPNDIPEGITGECLVIAGYDQTGGEWIKLGCVVDTEANTIKAELSQLCDFAVLGYEAVPTPAAFEVSSLNLSPTEVEIGETVNITVLVANTGGQSGSYQVILKINSVSEAGGEVAGMTTSVAEMDREVVIDASVSEQVSFTTSQDSPGLYLVEVNGLTGSFEVNQPLSPVGLTPAKPINWWLIGGIIAAVVIVALIIFLLRRRMRFLALYTQSSYKPPPPPHPWRWSRRRR